MLFSQFYSTSTGLSKPSEVKPSCLRGHFEEELSLNVDSSKALEAEDITVCVQATLLVIIHVSKLRRHLTVTKYYLIKFSCKDYS